MADQLWLMKRIREEENVQYFCECFDVCSLDVIDSSKQWKLMAKEGIVSHARVVQGLVVVREGLLCVSTDDFTHDDVLALIEHWCVD